MSKIPQTRLQTLQIIDSLCGFVASFPAITPYVDLADRSSKLDDSTCHTSVVVPIDATSRV